MNYKFSGQWGKVNHFLSYFFMMFLGLMTMVSCNQEEFTPHSGDGGGGEIRIGSGIGSLTRATDAGFELGDSIGLYLVKWQDDTTPGSMLSLGNYADNALFWLTTLPDFWTSTQKYYYPIDSSKLDFYAYYPNQSPAFDHGTFINLTVAADQSAYQSYTQSDFMLAKKKGVQRSNQRVHLDFYHQLSQIVFVLKPGNGFTPNDLAGAKLKIVNAITDATFDLSQKTDSVPIAGTTRADIVPYGSWKTQNGNLSGKVAILVPQQINNSTYVEVMIGSRRFTFKPTPGINLNPGCSRVFTITVNNIGIDIETEIHPWDECPPVNGDATEEVEEDWIVKMTMEGPTAGFGIIQTDNVWVDWGDGTKDVNVFVHTYTDGLRNHDIKFYGKKDALTSLNCGGNRLSSLDVTPNVALTSLECYQNQLSTLDVSQNVNLTNLNCEDNQLSTLNIRQNIALIGLYCTKNQLISLDVTQNIALTELLCEHNQLTSLDVNRNTELIYLWCYYNQLTSLDLSKNLALTDLDCKNNQLTSINVRQNTQLVDFYCDSNQLSVLDVSQNVKLTELRCRANLLKTLDVSQNIILKTFFCGENLLTELDVSKNVKLTYLNCINNQLSFLDVSQNVKMTYLNCGYNQLSSLDINQNKELAQLNCSYNQLTYLNVNKNIVLVRLYCNDNPCTNDMVSLKTVVDLLPDRTGEQHIGVLYINAYNDEIRTICTSKRWSVEQVSL